MTRALFFCPHCQSRVSFPVGTPPGQGAWSCPSCHGALARLAAAPAGGPIRQCLICGNADLFVRKDFPQRLGVTLVILGLGASCLAWYHHRVMLTFGILMATAFADLVLYWLMGDVLECYCCHAQYRGVSNLDHHGPFQLEVHERYRQQAGRLAKDATGGQVGNRS